MGNFHFKQDQVQESSSDKSKDSVIIKRIKINEFITIELTKEQLLKLIQGNNLGISFSFFIALISIGLTCLVSLLTTEADLATKTFFQVVVVCSLVLGVFFGCSSIKAYVRIRRESRALIKKLEE